MTRKFDWTEKLNEKLKKWIEIENLSNSIIGERLGISAMTVSKQIRKLGIKQKTVSEQRASAWR